MANLLHERQVHVKFRARVKRKKVLAESEPEVAVAKLSTRQKGSLTMPEE